MNFAAVFITTGRHLGWKSSDPADFPWVRMAFCFLQTTRVRQPLPLSPSLQFP